MPAEVLPRLRGRTPGTSLSQRLSSLAVFGQYALTKRTVVVIAIPYDLAALEAADEALPAPLAAAVSDDVDGGLGQVARLLAGAKRALILAGRGALQASRAAKRR